MSIEEHCPSCGSDKIVLLDGGGIHGCFECRACAAILQAEAVTDQRKLWVAYSILIVVFFAYPEVSEVSGLWMFGLVVLPACSLVLIARELYFKFVKKRKLRILIKR